MLLGGCMYTDRFPARRPPALPTYAKLRSFHLRKAGTVPDRLGLSAFCRSTCIFLHPTFEPPPPPSTAPTHNQRGFTATHCPVVVLCVSGMDPYRFQPGFGGSINAFCLPATFPQYLRTTYFNVTPPQSQYPFPPLPRQPRVLPSQGNPNPHHPLYPAYWTPSTMNPVLNNYSQPFSPGLSSDDARTFLTGNRDESAYASGPTGSFAQTHHHVAHNPFSFRPLVPGPAFDFGLPTAAPLKIETEHVDTVMQMRTTQVDTSQYSPVSAEEVWSASYGPDSPSSVDTIENSPATPAYDQQHDAVFNQYAAHDGSQDTQSCSNNSGAAHSLDHAQGSFNSFSSDSYARLPFSNNSFAANDQFSVNPMNIAQPQGLGIDHETAHVGSHAGGYSDPIFEAQAAGEANFSESEAEEEDVGSEGSATSPSRSERDQLLLDLRSQGYSYKEIKRMGTFTEAESTLRGRVRVLTKPKGERVRSPVWHPKDVSKISRVVMSAD